MIREASENDRTGFVLVGAGAIARVYAEAFAASERCELLAVCDLDASAAEAMAADFALDAFDSIDAMLHEIDDAVAAIVCTPPSTHRDVTCRLLEAGLHVLCEKPLSIDSASAQEMAAKAEACDRILTMASKFRCVADVRKAKGIVDSGDIGEVILFENAFTSVVDMSGRWNSNPAVSGGGVLIDNGTHSLDIARYFLGPIDHVNVVEGRRSQNLPVEDTVMLFIKSKTGIMGSIDLSWAINKNLDYFIQIHGTNGTIQVGWSQSRYRQNGDDWIVFGSGYNKIGAFQAQIDNFADSIKGEAELLIKAQDGVASVAVVEASYHALRELNWVGVESSAAPAVEPATVNAGSMRMRLEA